ncbi:MAG: glycosyltransferase family 4 protein [Leptospiraceae bacterium]|nr:glycosyltransferase family 4 protein [Leptospiraceae bacterium]MCP5499647.1 glycosyltransferase family 4 protein [Leptospiraceae bacterium]
MKIGIDCRMILHSGIGVHLENILKHLQKEEGFTYYLFAPGEILDKVKLPDFYQHIEYRAGVYSLSEMRGHPRMSEMDLLHIPHFNVPFPYIKKCIVTIHDIIPYRMNELHTGIKKRLYLFFSLYAIRTYAKKIVTVSDFTAKDLELAFSYPQERMQTIYNAVNTRLFVPGEKLKSFKSKYNLPERYLLSVGIGKEHKNLAFLLDALLPLWKNESLKLPLVLAGSGGKIPDYLKPYREEVAEFIWACPHLPYEELPELYRNAELLIYPSLYEGFGFPVLEAQAVACPVYSSNASVLPEILKDSAYYFNPRDKEELQKGLLHILSSEENRLMFVEKGLKNIERFSWERSAAEFSKLYKSFLV